MCKDNNIMLMAMFREVRNTFYNGYAEKGEFAVIGGKIAVSGYFPENSYALLDGAAGAMAAKVHKDGELGYIETGLPDGNYTGSIYRLKVPPDFVQLATEIDGYIKANGSRNLVSERFGEYSYTARETVGWEAVFRKSLDRYRKMGDGLLEELNG